MSTIPVGLVSFVGVAIVVIYWKKVVSYLTGSSKEEREIKLVSSVCVSSTRFPSRSCVLFLYHASNHASPTRCLFPHLPGVVQVQESWAKVAALGVEKVGVLLFKNIFTIAPSAVELFSFKDTKDLYNSQALKAHGKTVVSTVGQAVAGLRDLNALVPVLKNLGKTHANLGKGIGPAHYDIVGQALIKTLKEGLGAGFTSEVEKAWLGVYAVVSSTMQAGH